MTRRMRTSKAGLNLIKSFEGFRPVSVALGDGAWTVGYGHTQSARENVRVSREDAEAILREYDLPPIERSLSEKILAPLNQNEFDALVSFSLNIGLDAFYSSDVFSQLTSGERLNAAASMAPWRKARIDGRIIVVDALVRRRAAEVALFLEHPNGRPAAPSAIIKPQLDIAAAIMTPRERAVVVDAGETVSSALAEERRTARAMPRDETAPEAAARTVIERMTRKLGESERKDDLDRQARAEADAKRQALFADDDAAAPAMADIDGASVEEITAAVSALVGDGADETQAIAPQAKPSDTPPPFDRTVDLNRPVLTPIDDDGVVDDLAPIEPSPEVLEEALRLDDEINGHAHRGGPGLFSTIIFGALTAIGALLAAWGYDDIAGMATAPEAVTGEWQLYAGYLALALGAMLFLIMGYYFFRAIFLED